MRRRLFGVLGALALMAAACGDGINEGLHGQEGGDRGEFPGVDGTGPSETDGPDTTNEPDSKNPDGTEPDETEPESTSPDTESPDTTEPDDTSPETTDVVPPGEFGWEEISDNLDEGHLEVPLDYTDPSKGTITLYLVRHRAADPANRIGSLLVNPGGPGYGGTGLAESAEFVYGPDLVDRFDIIGWDPRGTGLSEPAVDCVDDYDEFFGLDSSPDDDAERQALIDAGTEFGAGCVQRSGEILAYVSTENSARDMDAIRAALGEETITYFGFSYGSELGATWVALFPDTVRAAVLDGAADPTVGYLQQNIQQATGFDATLTTFLAQCSAAPSCAFSNDGDADGAFDALMAQLDAEPLIVEPDRTPVTQGVAGTAVADAMYLESYWPQLEQALADAKAGDGAGLLALYDDYYGRLADGSYGNELEAYFAINCLDDPGSTGPDDLYSHEGEFAAAAPRLGRGWMAELTFCSVWPEESGGEVDVAGAGKGPVVVVGTTGDAATPLDSTRAMADALADGRLIIVEANQHTGYGLNTCVNDAVDTYLTELTAPEDELFCE